VASVDGQLKTEKVHAALEACELEQQGFAPVWGRAIIGVRVDILGTLLLWSQESVRERETERETKRE
jgi:hypothetical protein